MPTGSEIVRYTADKADEWNDFVARSKNGTFLFDRRYMDYHSDRFQDHSLMVYEKGRLYALLPANQRDDTFYTHQGLTYGGLIMNDRCRAATVCELFVMMNDYLRAAGFRHVVYKHVPWIYASQPAEEALFAIHNVCHATLRSRDVASVVDLCPPARGGLSEGLRAGSRIPFTTLRRRGVKRALGAGLRVGESNDFAGFWTLLEDNLQHRFQARPVHSLAEITLLHSRFPDRLRLFTVSNAIRMLGGTVIYVCGHTVKTQYISANEEGKQTGALDLLFDRLLQHYAEAGMRYFDFGTSNLTHNDDLNAPLIFQKEGFGARAVCYDTYEWVL